MKSYTDTQLKQALAKMLPGVVNRITLHTCDGDKEEHLFFRNRPQFYVQDSELLYLCWLVEETLTERQWEGYTTYIEACSHTIWSHQTLCHATWQQRTIALAKVKGITI